MDWKPISSVVAVFLVVPAVLAAQPAVRVPRPALAVRTYNNVGIPSERLRAARLHADAIFRGAGIDLHWMDCWYRNQEPADAPDVCRQPLAHNEVVLRLHAANAVAPTPYVAMGFSLVNLRKGVPFLATVWVDLVASVARSAGIDFDALLGRAIAHEIGHLLLNTSHHASKGLMRAGWTRSELQRGKIADWVFRQNEIAALQRAVAKRRFSGSRI